MSDALTPQPGPRAGTMAGINLIILHPGSLNDPAVIDRAFQEAMSALPRGYKPTGRVVLLPRHKLTGRCRLCGQVAKLSKEHVPPQASGNANTNYSHSIEDWLRLADKNHPVGGVHQQGGIWGYTLCASCNSLTGRNYGTEYKEWVIRAKNIFSQLPVRPQEIDRMPASYQVGVRFGPGPAGGVAPGAFVRQALSAMCSLSAEWDLAGEHPAVRRIVLEQSTEPLPEGLSLSMSLYLGPRARYAGPQLRVDAGGSWAWFMELAFPPFAFLMVLASNCEGMEGLSLGHLTEVSPKMRCTYEAILDVGFGWTPYPGDYRSTAMLDEAGG